MVVANAVAALAEIHEVSGKDVFQITSQSLFKLLRALNECTEWGQVEFLTCTLAASHCLKPTSACFPKPLTFYTCQRGLKCLFETNVVLACDH